MQNVDRLKQFLTTARARVNPDEVGIPRFGRRRVKGLRREEVAELAGVSSVWYSRFEAGRARLSIRALRAVARALRLTHRETLDLFSLALPELPEHERNACDVQARAEAGVLRVGALDLPMAQREMLRGLHGVAKRGFQIAQHPASWLEQDLLLENGEIDVAISYRFRHASVDLPVDEHFVCEEIATHVAVPAENGIRGPRSIHEFTDSTLSGPSGRMTRDLVTSARHEGFAVKRFVTATSPADFFGCMDRYGFAFITDDYASVCRAAGLHVHHVRDIGVVSHLVFRTRKGDTNPAVVALRDVLAS